MLSNADFDIFVTVGPAGAGGVEKVWPVIDRARVLDDVLRLGLGSEGEKISFARLNSDTFRARSRREVRCF